MTAERTPHADDSLLARPLVALTDWTLRAPRTVIAAALALAIVAIGVAVSGLGFRTSRLDLLNPRSEYNRRWLTYLAEFGSQDDAVIVVRSEERAALTAAIDDLAAQLAAQPQVFESILARRDLSRLKSKLLHYLPQDELARIEAQVSQATAWRAPAAGGGDPVQTLSALNEQLTRLGPANPQQQAILQAQYAAAAQMLLAAVGSGAAPAGGPPAASPAGLARASFVSAAPAAGDIARGTTAQALEQFDAQYLLADDGRLGFVLLRLVPQPGEAAANSVAIRTLRDMIAAARQRHPQAWIGLTGMPVIEHDEMQASQFDMLWTSLVSTALVLALYLASYGGLRHAILVNVLLALGTAYAFGFVTLAVGHLNILSAAFSAVLIGLGIDFAIHYIACYLKLRRQGCDEEEALRRMVLEVGPGVVTGGVTTAAAFYMAAMTDFVGVRELGLVAGGGILLCVLATIVVLPPLILLIDRRWPLVRVPTILPAGRWFQFPIRQPRTVILAVAGATVLLAVGASRLSYDHNLLNLQPRHLESADIERQLFTQLDDSVWYAVSLCRSREEVQTRKAAFEMLPLVAKTEELASLLPEPRHANRIAALSRQLAALQQPRPPAAAVDVNRLKRELARASELLARETPFETPALGLLAQVRGVLAALPPEEITRRLAEGHSTAIAAAIAPLAALQAMADPVPPRLADLPPPLVDRFIGKNQTFLLKVYARGNIWNMREMEAFVRAVESVDPRVTGHPVQTYYASRHMQQSFLWAGLYALIAVLILLWLDFRSLRHALLAMVPLAVGFVQMCGLLGWLDMPLNPANMIVLPLILGIGVDHGVHLVHLWRQQRGRFALNDSAAVAVILTAATTTASFGALIFARHQGLQSLGQVLTLGVTTCLGSSIVFFPALLAWLSRSGQERRERPRPGLRLARQPQTSKCEAHSPTFQVQRPMSKGLAATSPRPAPLAGLSPGESLAHAAAPPTAPAVLDRALPPPTASPATIAPSTAAQPETARFETITAAAPPVVEPAPPTLAPVTEEEIAALLDSALHRQPPRIADLPRGSEPGEDQEAVAAPRRRQLPRRSDAA